jgi:hypothetical protein
MKIEQFSLTVPQGREASNGYIELSHGTIYGLKFQNDSDRRCDVFVEIDGGTVGKWRINARSSIYIERPVHDTGWFVFYRVGTTEAKQVGQGSSDQSGLITATFMPEQPPDTRICYSRARGVTGLIGRSSQEFTSAPPIQYDHAGFVTINLRLVAVETAPRPLFSKSNPIPPPV